MSNRRQLSSLLGACGMLKLLLACRSINNDDTADVHHCLKALDSMKSLPLWKNDYLNDGLKFGMRFKNVAAVERGYVNHICASQFCDSEAVCMDESVKSWCQWNTSPSPEEYFYYQNYHSIEPGVNSLFIYPARTSPHCTVSEAFGE
eukprot:GHVH01010905.1.p1 GENE.GHVH01010905.1~~GHVH01010905.1.p1  ORF type:complete len:147 (+),score=9.12 GHVH01010905.1:238-678(+)